MKLINFFLLGISVCIFLSCKKDVSINKVNDSEEFKWTIFSTESSDILSNKVYDLEVNNNSIWMGLENGFSEFDGESFQHYYPAENGCKNNKVGRIRLTINKNIWIAGDGFLIKILGNDWEINTELFGFNIDRYWDLVIDGKGIIWFYFLSETSWENIYNSHLVSFNADCSEEHSPVFPINCTTNENGEFLIAESRDIQCYKDSLWVEVSVPDSSIGDIKKIAVDNSGVIWLVTEIEVIRLDGENWQSFSRPTDLYNISAFEVDKNDVVWAGFKGGIGYLDGNEWKIYDENNSEFPPYTVSDMVFDEDNNIWIGTLGGGIIKLEKLNLKSRINKDGV